jgi:hypothetical protein
MNRLQKIVEDVGEKLTTLDVVTRDEYMDSFYKAFVNSCPEEYRLEFLILYCSLLTEMGLQGKQYLICICQTDIITVPEFMEYSGLFNNDAKLLLELLKLHVETGEELAKCYKIVQFNNLETTNPVLNGLVH